MKLFSNKPEVKMITIPDFMTMKSYRDTEYGIEIVFRDADEIIRLGELAKSVSVSEWNVSIPSIYYYELKERK